MAHKSNKAATTQIGESVQTDAAPAQPQPTTDADGSTAGNAPALADVEVMTTESQSIAAAPDQTEDSPHARADVQADDFLTFDPTRKHLVRVVEVKGKHLTVRRFDKKSGKWLTKAESRERNSGISLSPEEAEKSFPGCVAAWTELSGDQAQPAQQSIAVTKKMSPEEEQYLKAIAMSSADLGAVIKEPTERITKHVGEAMAHEEEAKKSRREAQKEFEDNLAYFYEAKQRLLNPGYRTDVDGGKDRTPEENEKNFGAPNWESFNEQFHAYSLQHADRKLKAFAKAQGLLTDDGENIDAVEAENVEEAKLPAPRHNEDLTPQKKYEHIATAAMSIANANPEAEVSKQILAAAEHLPAPLTPISPDIFTEVLSFITKVSSSATDGEIKAEAKRLLGKMLIHRPTPDPSKILDAAQKEEQRKRNKRLASKNGGALGSATYNPTTNGTAEHIQSFEPNAGEEHQAARAEKAAGPAQATPAKNTTQRFRWVERRMGDLTELVIMDGNKVYDCYPSDATQEVQAVIEKLNMPKVVEMQGTPMAAD